MMTTPARMAAIAFRRSSSLADPGPHDLRVAVRAVSVNPLDTKIRTGLTATPDSVRSLSRDSAGIVEAVGEAVTLFRPGQAVHYVGYFDQSGNNAQFHLVDERSAGRMP